MTTTMTRFLSVLLLLPAITGTASAFSPSLTKRTITPSRSTSLLGASSSSSVSSPLDVGNKIVSTIIIFDVKDQHEQEELVNSIQNYCCGGTLRDEPGFVSANLHKSLDGTKVANYAQWESEAALQNFRDKQQSNGDATSFFGRYGQPDARIYDIFAWEDKDYPNDGPVVRSGLYVHFAEFDMLSADLQPKMEELAQQHLRPAMEMEGLISATFHKSHDGMKVINYGQWENLEAIERLKKQPGFSTDNMTPYWDGVAINEHHLYELVAVVHKDGNDDDENYKP